MRPTTVASFTSASRAHLPGIAAFIDSMFPCDRKSFAEVFALIAAVKQYAEGNGCGALGSEIVPQYQPGAPGVLEASPSGEGQQENSQYVL